MDASLLAILRRRRAGGDPYAAFDQYVAVSSAADYTTATGVNRWINRAEPGATYDWVQSVAGNQPNPAGDGLTFDNSDDYMRCPQILADIQTYIAGSQNPNILIMHRVTLTDGDGSPPGFLTTSGYWAAAPLAGGNGFLRSVMLANGRLRRTLQNTAGTNLVGFDLILPAGDLGPGTYTIAEHFHDALLDTYYDGALADSRAFDFSPVWAANNPFSSANFTLGCRLTTDSTISDPLSGTVHAFAYINNPTTVPVFP
jgi:hypothetical protein